jgi:uncharacterized phage protein gp47/JayE
MPFIPRTYEQVRDDILRDISNQNPQAAVGADSDFRMRANAEAAAIEGLYQNMAWLARQILVDTADDDVVLQRATLYGMSQKPANGAVGSITFTGTPGSLVNAGVECKSLDGQAYVTTAFGNLGSDGTLTLAAQASVSGSAGNQAAGTAVTLTSAPPGVSSSATIVSMVSGTDIESIASLLDRVLDRMRHPPAGGNQYDYRRWAMEVPGVTSAWCYPLRRGLGTTDVAVLSNGVPAPQALLNTVKAYIESVNPSGGDCMVVTASLQTVNVAATVALLPGVSLATVQAAVQSALAAYIAGLEPGATVMRSRILAIITDVPGVTDVNLVSPAASVVTAVNASTVQLATLGTVALS